jgi:hypothetical protein
LESQNAYSQLRNNSHQLRRETGHWKNQRKLGNKGCVCFATPGKVETEKHFILECEAFKDSRDNYVSILTTNSWNNLFNEGTVEKVGELIIKLNMKRTEMQKSVYEAVCPIGYC